MDFIKKYWLSIILMIVVVWFLGKSINVSIENYQLAKSGLIMKAVITSKKWESSSYRNSDGFYYIFSINGNIYEGHTFDNDLLPNDSIRVVFLPKNPNVNRPLDFIQRNYNAKHNSK
jgi:hypothetical protein